MDIKALNGLDKIILNREQLTDIRIWTMKKDIELFGTLVEEDESDNKLLVEPKKERFGYVIDDGDAMRELLSEPLLVNKPFKKFMIVMVDDNEMQAEEAAMKDIQGADGEQSKFKSTTKEFLNNIATQMIEFAATNPDKRIKNIDYADNPLPKVIDWLINYYLPKKSKNVLLQFEVGIHCAVLDFEEEKISVYASRTGYHGKLDSSIPPTFYYEKALKEESTFVKVGEETFQSSVEVAAGIGGFADKQRKFIEQFGYATTIEQLGLFMLPELVASAVYFLQYANLTNALVKKVERRKVIKAGTNTKKNKKPIQYKTIETVKYEYLKPQQLGDESEYLTEEVERKYRFLIAKWSVRGHWRKYKTGKRVWIEPQVRKRKEKESELLPGVKNYITKGLDG